jgi:hypothetical protein
MRRPFALAVGSCALGGVLALVAAGRTWGEATVGGAGAARQHVSVTGHDVTSAFPAVGIAILALTVAVLAARGLMRRLAALLVVAIGVAAVAEALRARADVGHALAGQVFASASRSVGGSRPAWWLLAVVAGALAAVGGGAVVLGAGRETGLGARYEPPGPPSGGEESSPDTWDAIERGQDPTVGR